jgi:hypothetical protein
MAKAIRYRNTYVAIRLSNIVVIVATTISMMLTLLILMRGIHKSFSTAQAARPGQDGGLMGTFGNPNFLQRGGGVTLVTGHLND